jgi:V/A-type H+-transporting ATPase subunit A
VKFLLDIAAGSKTIASNIMLMGEKGITDETYIRYQKAELLDAVFLQQNSFHEVDGVTNPERLRMMFEMVWKVIDAPVESRGKKKYARISILSTSLSSIGTTCGQTRMSLKNKKRNF